MRRARSRAWVLAVGAALAWACALTAVDGGTRALPDMGVALLGSAPWVGLWLASAAGLGRWIGSRMRLHEPFACWGVGVAALLAMDQWAGSFGLLASGLLPALALLAPGWWLLSRQGLRLERPGLSLWSAAPLGVACGALLAACLVPPGFLWSTEFGGYDALSYHLQLPREWLATGSIRPLRHVAYSGLPNLVEGGFMHLMAMRQDPREAALATQMLHAAMMVLAAGASAEWVRGMGAGAWGRTVTAVAILGTPWVLVTGSLPYSEAGVALGMALAMRGCTDLGRWRGGLLTGMGVAMMVGAKASSVALGVPGVLLCAAWRDRRWLDPRWLSAAAIMLAAGLAPWLLRNAWFTGEPLFPLWTTGTGWWTDEQSARWAEGHRTAAGWTERTLALWRQWLAFGVGSSPAPGEPWRWLWGPLPWTGLVASAWLALHAERRRSGLPLPLMVLASVAAWMAFTHLQSRFLIVTLVPLAAATGLVADRLANGHPAWRRSMALACVAWCLLPTWTLTAESRGVLALSGRLDVPTGELDWALLSGSDDEEVRRVREAPTAEASLAFIYPGQRTLSVGWSAPFWVAPRQRLDWSTVWDRNPLQDAMDSADPMAWLRDRYDLLVLDEPMLRRWERSGWLDPSIRADAVLELLKGREATPLTGGRVLVSLREGLRPTWPERAGRRRPSWSY